MFRRTAPLLATLLALPGCLHSVRPEIDATVCDLAARPRDVLPSDPAPPTPDSGVRPARLDSPPDADRELPPRKAGAAEPRKPDAETKVPLTIPKGLPGGGAGPLRLPALHLLSEAERRKVLERYYPDLGPLGPDPQPQPGPHGRPLSLEDLQHEALAKNPSIAQAVANVIAARGTALQAGLPPNPNISFQHGQGSSISAQGLEGFGVEQVIRTFGKLQLARAAAAIDLRNAELAQRRAETDLMTQVRSNYFAVLVADEGVRVNRALVEFTEQIYRNQVTQLIKGGTAAPYEPMQLRALVTQARVALLAARNRYTSAWKQLAAALGDPGMPPTQLVGSRDMPYPIYDHADVLDRVLRDHTDVLTAENTIRRAQYALQLARVTPYPDVDVAAIIQKDMLGGVSSINNTVTMTIPFPIFDRNQGGILAAEAQLGFAQEEPHRVRIALTRTLADAFERYETNRATLLAYRDSILPDSVRSYEELYKRYRALFGPNAPADVPDFTAVVTAQQTLVMNVATYLSTLALFWQAVVDVTDLLQTDNLYAYARRTEPPAALPDLPCFHPCAPLQDRNLEKMDGEWPNAVPPGPTPPAMPKVDQAATRTAKPDEPGPRKETWNGPVPMLGAPAKPDRDAILLEPPPVLGQSAAGARP
jgi:cobalt-zinc-cadmium efflux system outer membrane protein